MAAVALRLRVCAPPQTSDLVALTAFLTGGVYAQYYDQRADFDGASGTEFEYGDGWFPGLGEHEVENSGGFVP
eukprot:SAG31_NODE_9903_length_1214_cov_1.043946_2_plen_72_part_01